MVIIELLEKQLLFCVLKKRTVEDVGPYQSLPL